MTRRTFWISGLVVALLVAGVASYYASSHPDGLEYVAEQTGFIDSAEDSATADSPLADYQTTGVDDERLSVGLSGVTGVLVVLVLAGGLAWLLRRRGGLDTASQSSAGSTSKGSAGSTSKGSAGSTSKGSAGSTSKGSAGSTSKSS